MKPWSSARVLVAALALPLLAWQEPAALLPMSTLTLLIVWRHQNLSPALHNFVDLVRVLGVNRHRPTRVSSS